MARKAVATKAKTQSNVPELSREQELEAYREMLLIRRFEEKAGQMYGMGLIGGFCHLYIGQEAVVTGITMASEKGKDAQITGICQARAGAAVPLGTSHADYPGAVAAALTRLRDDGIEGKFAVVLNEQLYKDLASRTDGGYPILSHVQRLIDGEIVWAPGLDGGLVISQRGGDFELTVGQDFSIGYLDHDRETVQLYIEESFTFLILTEQAAIPLSTGKK